MCDLWWTKWEWGRLFSCSSVSPVNINPPVPHNYLYLNISLTIAKGEGWKHREQWRERERERNTLSHFTLQRFHVRITSTTKGLLQPIISTVADMDAHGALKAHARQKIIPRLMDCSSQLHNNQVQGSNLKLVLDFLPNVSSTLQYSFIS
jgi:hypothetical protein